MNSLRERLNNKVSDPLEQMGALADMLEFGPQRADDASVQLAVGEFVEAVCNPSGASDVYLPKVEDMTGRKVWVKNVSANTVTVNTHADDVTGGVGNMDGATTFALGTQYMAVLFGSDGVDWHVLSHYA